MKWRIVSISLMILTLLLISCTVLKTLYVSYPKNSKLFSNEMNKLNIQLGYYDLLSKNSELYNVHFHINGNNIELKLRNPDDNHLQIKLNMALKKVTLQGKIYSYEPIFTSKSNANLLLTNTLGYLEHGDIMLIRLSSPGGKVTLTPTGMIINHI